MRPRHRVIIHRWGPPYLVLLCSCMDWSLNITADELQEAGCRTYADALRLARERHQREHVRARLRLEGSARVPTDFYE